MSARNTRERREEIVRLATTSGLASVAELSAQFAVTASTIRRDLALLQEEGRLARTYGGAIATAPYESPIGQRAGEAAGAKLAIARWAASQVRNGEVLLLDAGTTTGALAHELRDFPALTIVTTGMSVLQELSRSATVTATCLGGTLRPVSQGFVGPVAEAALERMTFDRVFLGADGVTAEDGVCEADPQQTRLKELMTRRTREVYVLAHAAKLGRRPFHHWAPLPSRWTLVTDSAATEAALAPFRDRDVDVVVARDT